MLRRILVVDDMVTNRIILKAKLTSAHYDVLQASSGTEALEKAKILRPDLILLEMSLPDINGINVCKQLKKIKLTEHIPIILLSSEYNEAKTYGLKAGANELFKRPIDDMLLLARIRSLLRTNDTMKEIHQNTRDMGIIFPKVLQDQSNGHQQKIALISENIEQGKTWKKYLQQDKTSRVSILDHGNALAHVNKAQEWDAFVIATCPEKDPKSQNGFDLLAELRSRKASRHAAYILVTPDNKQRTMAMALDLGAHDVLAAPLDSDELRLRVNTQIAHKKNMDLLRASRKKDSHLAITDPLTGLYNRHYVNHYFSKTNKQRQLINRQLAVMLIDIDHFKRVNDKYGHGSGDKALQEVAKRLRVNLRNEDIIARIGGEEFLIILPNTNPFEAQQISKRLIWVVGKEPIPITEEQFSITITVSIGLVIVNNQHINNFQDVVEQADIALYQSKTSGRNQVTAHCAKEYAC